MFFFPFYSYPNGNESCNAYSIYTLLFWPQRAKSTASGPRTHTSTCQSTRSWSQLCWALFIYLQRFPQRMCEESHHHGGDLEIPSVLVTLLLGLSSPFKSIVCSSERWGSPLPVAYQVAWWPVNRPKTGLSVIFSTWTSPRVPLPVSIVFLYPYVDYEQVFPCLTLVLGTCLSYNTDQLQLI